MQKRIFLLVSIISTAIYLTTGSIPIQVNFSSSLADHHLYSTPIASLSIIDAAFDLTRNACAAQGISIIVSGIIAILLQMLLLLIENVGFLKKWMLLGSIGCQSFGIIMFFQRMCIDSIPTFSVQNGAWVSIVSVIASCREFQIVFCKNKMEKRTDNGIKSI
jgi:hypothetical protein